MGVVECIRLGACIFVTSYHVDRTNWKLNVPKDTHERFNSPFPNLGPDVLDGHPKSGAVCGRSEACASGRVVEGTAEYDERLEDINQFFVDLTMWESEEPKEIHERFNRPFPNLGPDVLDGHPTSGAM